MTNMTRTRWAMSSWTAVAFLIVTARGRAGEPVGEFF